MILNPASHNEELTLMKSKDETFLYTKNNRNDYKENNFKNTEDNGKLI